MGGAYASSTRRMLESTKCFSRKMQKNAIFLKNFQPAEKEGQKDFFGTFRFDFWHISFYRL
jgi:hypothetical protein